MQEASDALVKGNEEEEGDEVKIADDNPDELLDVVLVPEFCTVVAKVRKTEAAKMSTVRYDDNLQPQNIVSFGNEKAPFLNRKTQ